MSSEKGFGNLRASNTLSSSSTSSGGGFAFKPSALSSLTSHIDTKVVTNQNTEVESNHTDAVKQFLSNKSDNSQGKVGSETSDEKAEAKKESGGAFVFGKNIDTRVLNAPNSPEPTTATSGEEGEKDKGGENSSGDVAAADDTEEKAETEASEKKPKNIFEAASEGLRKKEDADKKDRSEEADATFNNPENLKVFHSAPVLPPAEAVKTGEENEDTVAHAVCKLHLFESGKSQWLERGRGLVKVNRDRTTHKHRIVMRQQGIFRLLLNSPVFADMRIKQVSPRALHVTATEVESGSLKIHLLTSTTPTETATLFQVLGDIIDQVRANSGGSGGDSSSETHHDEWKAASETRQAGKHRRSPDEDQVDGDEDDSDHEQQSAKRAAVATESSE